MRRISFGVAFLMVIAALVTDVLQAALELIPFLGIFLSWLVDIAAIIGFSMWFNHFGHSLMRERPLALMGTTLVEAMPFVNMVPAWTFFVVTSILAANMKVRSARAV